MKNTVYSISQISKILEPVFSRYHVKKAVLFGSYAKGDATRKSDIDICVDSDLKGLDFMVLVDDAHIILDKSLDMIPLRCVKPQSIVFSEINETGVIIYEK